MALSVTEPPAQNVVAPVADAFAGGAPPGVIFIGEEVTLHPFAEILTV